jgi:hypothetical protein
MTYSTGREGKVGDYFLLVIVIVASKTALETTKPPTQAAREWKLLPGEKRPERKANHFHFRLRMRRTIALYNIFLCAMVIYSSIGHGEARHRKYKLRGF